LENRLKVNWKMKKVEYPFMVLQDPQMNIARMMDGVKKMYGLKGTDSPLSGIWNDKIGR